ncbi:MAG: pirin family protein [Acidobacteria bacterium]|nr:pirin family protein [Acidobacteriota bacterium]
MITVRPGNERGHTEIGWLDSYHTFSFDQYFDPRFMGFRHLRVLNEDWVQPGHGFPTHPHRDMEIITYVLQGALGHKDSMGNGSLIRPGEVQRMSAGTGITHSEHNASDSEPVHLLQIWILPEEKRLQPSYEQREFKRQEMRGRLRLVAAHNPRDGAVKIHQSVELFVAQLEPGETATHQLAPSRHAWVQVARGKATLNGLRLKAGDGAAVGDELQLEIRGDESSELLLFDLA